ncbi:MAG TPA: hypothetical protein VNM69_06650 [Bacillus sp. (in: firmicutes)]|nr:hypothetical protein [Bacillus sp. (in: firmicutes)]
MSKKRRIQVTLSEGNAQKIEETAERYGITVNAFMAFILGQWVDMNYNAQAAMASKLEEILATTEDALSNPHLLGMIKEILKEDEEFKKAAKEKLESQLRNGEKDEN